MKEHKLGDGVELDGRSETGSVNFGWRELQLEQSGGHSLEAQRLVGDCQSDAHALL